MENSTPNWRRPYSRGGSGSTSDRFDNSTPSRGRHNFKNTRGCPPNSKGKKGVSKDTPAAHPFKYHLDSFVPDPSRIPLETPPPPPKPLSETPLFEVTTKEDFDDLLQMLNQEEIIGIDVEYSEHGYRAVTALVQISTMTVDILVDAIALKDEMLLLEEIFLNPDILKVFHAGDLNDMRWLQQDFGLFFLNTFDTQIAMKALSHKSLSLKSVLLEKYMVYKDQSLQRADFRTRPLPQNLKDYARTDSHYLINLYYDLKCELMEADMLLPVLKQCHDTCKTLYTKVDESELPKKMNTTNSAQREALLNLNAWRNRIAEELDKGVGIILPKKSLKDLATQLPTDPLDIKILAQMQLTQEHVAEVLEIILKAREKLEVDKTEGGSKNNK